MDNIDLLRWRDFSNESPPISDTENMSIIAASRGMEPGEFYIDIAGYNVHSGNYTRDFFEHTPIEYWRPIGPLPEWEE